MKNAGVNLTEVIEDTIRRVKAEAAEHAAKLGLPVKGTKDVAAEEWNFWDEQSEDWDGEDLWRSFPEPIAARVRCLWALDICLIPLEYIEEGGGGTLRESIKTVDLNLEVLRTYAPKAAPEKEARALLEQDKIKRQIRELKKKLAA